MQAQNFFRDVFQNIEGGVGFWSNMQFPTKSPKYKILGIPDCYTTKMGSPGWPFADPNALADEAMGLAQLSNRILVPPDGEGSGLSKGQLPEYFVDGKATWVSKIPKETGLATATFYPPNSEDSYHPYVSPTKPGAWTSPGPTGEPQTVTLGDGTKVTYAWYKFVDQPALQNLKLTEDQNRQLQSRIELLHKNWTITGKYMKPPSKGSLVSMDPKLIVEPPSGLEVGYVPIVTKQESS